MTAVPTPGANDVWGAPLNAFLGTHADTSTGALLPSAVRTGHNTPLVTNTLSVDTANPWTVSIPSLSGFVKVRIVMRGHVTGTTPFDYSHTFAQFNGDTSTANYAWSVKNTDGSTDSLVVMSNIGQLLPLVTNSQSILIGHAQSSDAVDQTIPGIHEIEIYYPGEAGITKNMTVTNLVLTDFATYGALNPIKMHGCGFWKGPAAITSISFITEFNSWAAGSTMSVYPLI